MLFKTVQEMIVWLRNQAKVVDQVAHDADYYNNNASWVGQVNPKTGVYVDYKTVDYEEGIRLRECADMLDSLNVIAIPIIKKVESNDEGGEESYDVFSDEEEEFSNWHTKYFDTLELAQEFVNEVISDYGIVNNPKFICDKNKYGVSYTYD